MCFVSDKRARLTCSAQWWDGCQIVAAASALQQLCWSCLSHRQGFPLLANRGNGTDAQIESCSPGQRGSRRRFGKGFDFFPCPFVTFHGILRVFQSQRLIITSRIGTCAWWWQHVALKQSTVPPYPVVGDQEVTHCVTFILLLPFKLDGEVSIHHRSITGPILSTFLLLGTWGEQSADLLLPTSESIKNLQLRFKGILNV